MNYCDGGRSVNVREEVEEEEECWPLAAVSRNATDMAAKDSSPIQQVVY